jgi:ribosomal protein L21E
MSIEFKPGDLVRVTVDSEYSITEPGRRYYSKGDLGRVISTDADGEIALIRFENQKEPVRDAEWYANTKDLERMSKLIGEPA